VRSQRVRVALVLLTVMLMQQMAQLTVLNLAATKRLVQRIAQRMLMMQVLARRHAALRVNRRLILIQSPVDLSDRGAFSCHK